MPSFHENDIYDYLLTHYQNAFLNGELDLVVSHFKYQYLRRSTIHLSWISLGPLQYAGVRSKSTVFSNPNKRAPLKTQYSVKGLKKGNGERHVGLSDFQCLKLLLQLK